MSEFPEDEEECIEDQSPNFPTPPPPIDFAADNSLHSDSYFNLSSHLSSHLQNLPSPHQHEKGDVNLPLPDGQLSLQINKLDLQLQNQLYGKVTYVKKNPVCFIPTKYWNHCMQVSRQFSVKQIKLSHDLRQVLKSFYLLYREYSFVCDNCLPSYQDIMKNAATEASMKKVISEQNENDQTKYHAYNISNMNEGDNHPDIVENGNLSDDEISRFVDSPTLKTMHLPYFRKKFFNTKIFSSGSKVCYDKIKCKATQHLEVYVKDKVRQVRMHQYCRTVMNSSGQVKKCWELIPIALELLLPKCQMKVEKVMSKCDFLVDPLEVLAELRTFNYSVDSCVAHFQKSLDMRKIIDEFVGKPNEINPLTYNNNTICLSRDNLMTQDHNGYQLALNEISDAMFPCKSEVKELLDNCKGVSPNLTDSSMQTDYISDTEMFTGGIFKSETETQTPKSHDAISMDSLQTTLDSLTMLKNSREEMKQDIVNLKKKFSAVISLLIRHITQSLIKIKEVNINPLQQKEQTRHFLLQIADLKNRLLEEEKRRKYMFNMMQEQLGNIRVYCRCRDVPNQKSILEIPNQDTIMTTISPCEEFKFDKVFAANTSQGDLYREFEPLVLSFIDGYNVCFITYGGEASGKTYTLIGDKMTNDEGLMLRALRTILKERIVRKNDWTYKITAAAIEIYNDSYIDFLTSEKNIQLPIDSGLDKVYDVLKSVPVNTEKDVEALLEICRVKRKVTKTALNPASSRSHLMTLIRLRGLNQIHGQHFCSYLGLCDLAGFEDIIKAKTHGNQQATMEAGYINKSLTAFNRVFVTLRKQDPLTVPYRETKLTHLMKPFITNQGKCCLLVMVRSDRKSLGSTQNTLRFGRETRGVKLGRAKRQID